MKKIVINGIRNINRMIFVLPDTGLHIITGKNGSGKTTLFTCISRICNSNAYRYGFQSSPYGTLDVFNGSISYFFNEEGVTYTKRDSGEWRPSCHSTVLQKFGYPSVINITTKNERVFSQDIIIPRNPNMPDQWLNEKLNTILGTDKFTMMVPITTGDLRGRRGNSDAIRRRNTAYAIPLVRNHYYTEQNFSFGEIVLLNLLHDIKEAQEGSLVLVDELELALHPSAQVGLILALRELAELKRLTILVTTHSASIIRNERKVILLEQKEDSVEVLYECPPAKAIGAIGLREDTAPDIIVLVEDRMAKSFFNALKQQYFSLEPQKNYLDIRVLEIGGFQNVINFYTETKNYIFYNNIYVVALMDKDVETDIIPYSVYGNQELIREYQRNSRYLKFLPYTPEVLLAKAYYGYRVRLLEALKNVYNNQQLWYDYIEQLNFEEYANPLPNFQNQGEYNQCVGTRGNFRNKCKRLAEGISTGIADQLNVPVEEIDRFVYKFAVENCMGEDVNVQTLLAPIMKRLN